MKKLFILCILIGLILGFCIASRSDYETETMPTENCMNDEELIIGVGAAAALMSIGGLGLGYIEREERK